jgi:hypothetical protein
MKTTLLLFLAVLLVGCQGVTGSAFISSGHSVSPSGRYSAKWGHYEADRGRLFIVIADKKSRTNQNVELPRYPGHREGGNGGFKEMMIPTFDWKDEKGFQATVRYYYRLAKPVGMTHSYLEFVIDGPL